MLLCRCVAAIKVILYFDIVLDYLEVTTGGVVQCGSHKSCPVI